MKRRTENTEHISENEASALIFATVELWPSFQLLPRDLAHVHA